MLDDDGFGRVLRPIGEEGVSERRGVVRDGRECYKKASTGSGLVERKAGRCGRALAGRWLAKAGSRSLWLRGSSVAEAHVITPDGHLNNGYALHMNKHKVLIVPRAFLDSSFT